MNSQQHADMTLTLKEIKLQQNTLANSNGLNIFVKIPV